MYSFNKDFSIVLGIIQKLLFSFKRYCVTIIIANVTQIDVMMSRVATKTMQNKIILLATVLAKAFSCNFVMSCTTYLDPTFILNMVNA